MRDFADKSFLRKESKIKQITQNTLGVLFTTAMVGWFVIAVVDELVK